MIDHPCGASPPNSILSHGVRVVVRVGKRETARKTPQLSGVGSPVYVTPPPFRNMPRRKEAVRGYVSDTPISVTPRRARDLIPPPSSHPCVQRPCCLPRVDITAGGSGCRSATSGHIHPDRGGGCGCALYPQLNHHTGTHLFLRGEEGRRRRLGITSKCELPQTPDSLCCPAVDGWGLPH